MLAARWHTTRLAIDDVTPADAEAVLDCLAESADLAALDPTFGPAPRVDIDDLIARSQREANAAPRSFQMQMIRQRNEGGLVGYWHLMQVPDRPEAVGVSILLVRPPFRGQRMGQELVTEAARQLAARYAELWARVFLANPRAIQFWATLGFDQLTPHRGRIVHPPAATPSLILMKRLGPATA